MRFGWKPSFATAASTRSRVCAELGPSSLSTRETVLALTPTSRATSARVGRRVAAMYHRSCAFVGPDPARAGPGILSEVLIQWAVTPAALAASASETTVPPSSTRSAPVMMATTSAME